MFKYTLMTSKLIKCFHKYKLKIIIAMQCTYFVSCEGLFSKRQKLVYLLNNEKKLDIQSSFLLSFFIPHITPK